MKSIASLPPPPDVDGDAAGASAAPIPGREPLALLLLLRRRTTARRCARTPAGGYAGVWTDGTTSTTAPGAGAETIEMYASFRSFSLQRPRCCVAFAFLSPGIDATVDLVPISGSITYFDFFFPQIFTGCHIL